MKSRKRTPIRNPKGIATWLKWVLGLVIGGTVLMFAACGIIGALVWNGASKAVDPAAAKETASKIAVLEELPADRYQFKMGLDLMGMMTLVQFDDTKNKLSWVMVKVPNQDKGKTPDVMVEEFAQKGVPTGGSGDATMTIGIQSRGKTTVGGIEMPYLVGTTNTEEGVQPVYLGLVVPPGSPNAILLCAAGTAKTEINMTAINEFLSKIKSFK